MRIPSLFGKKKTAQMPFKSDAYSYVCSLSLEDGLNCPLCCQVFGVLPCCERKICVTCLQSWALSELRRDVSVYLSLSTMPPRKTSHLSCPFCRQVFYLAQLGESPAEQELLDALRVACLFAESGCAWVGERRILGTHLSNDCTHAGKGGKSYQDKLEDVALTTVEEPRRVSGVDKVAFLLGVLSPKVCAALVICGILAAVMLTAVLALVLSKVPSSS